MSDSIDQITAESIRSEFATGADRMGRIEDDLSSVRAELKANTEATQAVAASTEAVAASTAELVEMFHAMKGAFKVFNMIGSFAKPMAYVIGLATACVGMWAAIKTGIHPK